MNFICIVFLFLLTFGFQGSNLPQFEFNLDLENGSFYSESLKHFRFPILIAIENAWKEFEKIDKKDEILKSYSYVSENFPKYALEIEYIANFLDLPISKIWALQIVYEMYYYCTSIVSRLPNGHILHGRDLDFRFREISGLAFIAIYTRNNTELFRSITLPAFTGAITCMKKGFYGLTINARHSNKNSSHMDNIYALQKGKPLTLWLSRISMENSNSYEEIINFISNTESASPGYYIISGLKDNEGCVITKERNQTIDIWNISSKEWFLVQVNTDHWLPISPGKLDRRTPAIQRMNSIGLQNISAEKLLKDVLNLWPNFNYKTLFTAVMIPAENYLLINLTL